MLARLCGPASAPWRPSDAQGLPRRGTQGMRLKPGEGRQLESDCPGEVAEILRDSRCARSQSTLGVGLASSCGGPRTLNCPSAAEA